MDVLSCVGGGKRALVGFVRESKQGHNNRPFAPTRPSNAATLLPCSRGGARPAQPRLGPSLPLSKVTLAITTVVHLWGPYCFTCCPLHPQHHRPPDCRTLCGIQGFNGTPKRSRGGSVNDAPADLNRVDIIGDVQTLGTLLWCDPPTAGCRHANQQEEAGRQEEGQTHATGRTPRRAACRRRRRRRREWADCES